MDFSTESFFELTEYPHRGLFEGCQHPWEALAKLESYIQEGKIEGRVDPGAYLINREKITIGQGAVIEAGAYLEGPCIIGAGTQVRHGAYVKGFVVTGENCVIGHATEIKRSILLDGASAPHFNYVGDSILGRGVNLGAGVTCANLRLDRNPITILGGGKRYETGLKKLGAILADGVQIGCHCVLNPGTVVGKGTITFPCLNLSGAIPPSAKVRR